MVHAGVRDAVLTGGAMAIRDALQYRTVLVRAESGWGKSTAVRRALSACVHTWCDLASAPRERGALIYALARVFSLELGRLGPLLHVAEKQHSLGRVIAWLTAAIPDGSLLVFDDLQVVMDDATSIAFLRQLVAHPDFRFLLITRPHSRLDELNVIFGATITESALRLSRTEICEYFGNRDASPALV